MTETKAFAIVRNRGQKSVTVTVTLKARKYITLVVIYFDGKDQWIKGTTTALSKYTMESKIPEWCLTALADCLYSTIDNYRVEREWRKLFSEQDFLCVVY